MRGLVQRLIFLKQIWSKWWVWGEVVWTVIAAAFVFRDKYLPENLRKQFVVPGWLDKWSWLAWIFGALVLALFATFETSFQKWNKINDISPEERQHRREVLDGLARIESELLGIKPEIQARCEEPWPPPGGPHSAEERAREQAMERRNNTYSVLRSIVDRAKIGFVRASAMSPEAARLNDQFRAQFTPSVFDRGTSPAQILDTTKAVGTYLVKLRDEVSKGT